MTESALENLLPTGAESRRRTGPADPPPATRRRPGVLVADDEAGVRAVLHVGLEQQGFCLWLAADGHEALHLYWHHREAIDVVLLDVCMPVLDGPQTLAALRELNPQVRCCFMSRELGRYTERGLRDLGAAAVLPKPFRPAEVALVLRQLAGKAGWRPSTSGTHTSK
jgi:two-component system, OmpR family, response regulator